MQGAGSTDLTGQRFQNEVSRAFLGHGLTSTSMKADKVLSEEVASEVMSESWETQVSPQLGTWQDMQHVDQALDMQQKSGQ